MIRGIILSDLHCGHVGGLTPPQFMREDLKEYQSIFWSWYVDHLARYAPYDFMIGLGDFVDGEGKKGTLDTVITDLRKQAEAAALCIDQSGVPGEACYLVRGTPFHTNGVMEYEDAIADSLGCDIRDTQRLEIAGWKIHSRHVAGRSDTPYGQGTPLLKELARLEHEALVEEKTVPDIVLRGHVHYSMMVQRNGRMAVDSPCLMLPIGGANGRRYTAWDYTVGFGILDLADGIEPLYRCVKMPTRLVHDGGYRCVM